MLPMGPCAAESPRKEAEKLLGVGDAPRSCGSTGSTEGTGSVQAPRGQSPLT